ncbi:DUF6701 domain-containing protein [Salinibius halmophilus]|uniref:DUF6701 domain-containing protein n=1 Tax=Salinibius halmophilus TaxID=1853216 RepID=UPI000E672217|nr:DUF6701 domain-containing protein [Salinibius halmophilus]
MRAFALFLLSALTSFASANPNASWLAGSASINELSFSSNDIEFVEIYFSQDVAATNWSLISNVPAQGGAVDGNCSIPNGSYRAGEFLVITGNCLAYHPTEREYYLLDGSGQLIHLVSQWTTGNQAVGGDFGEPDNWANWVTAPYTNLDDVPADSSNYCALTDGETPEISWDEGCQPTQSTSNGTLNTPTCGQVFTSVVNAQSSITFLDNSYVDNGGSTTLTATTIINSSSQQTCIASNCTASGTGSAKAGLPVFQASTDATSSSPFTASDTIPYRSDYNLVQVYGGATTNVRFATGSGDWRINTLSIGSAVTLTFTPGDYYINSIIIGPTSRILVDGPGLVRLFVRDDVDFGDQSTANMIGDRNPGDAGELFIASYGNFYQGRGSQISANIYARQQANMGTSNTTGGDDSLTTWHYGSVSGESIVYSNNMRSVATGDDIHTGGVCDSAPAPNNLSLISHWTFDEGVSSFANEVSGVANVSLLNGVSRTNAGKVCGALDFDGSATSLPADTSFQLNDAFPAGSFAAWVKPTENRESPLFFSYASNKFYAVFTTTNNSDNHNNEGVIQFGIPRQGNSSPAPFYARHGLSNRQMRDWHHIAVSWNTDTDSYAIWLNGQPLTLNYVSSGFTPRADIELSFGVAEDNLVLDEVHFYQGEIDQSTVDNLINASRNCPFDIDEIRIVHDGDAITCAAEPVTFEAWQNGQLKTNFNGTLNLDVTENSGRWYNQLNQQLGSGNNGRASISFDGSEGGRYTLYLQQNQPGDYDINATDGMVSETTFDPILTYQDTGLRWVDSNGTAINSANGNHVYTAGDINALGIQVVATNTNDKTCQTVFPENGQLQLAFASQCLNPGQCQLQTLLGQASLSAIANPQTLDNGQPTSQQTWQFNSDSEAMGQVSYQDVGQIRLTAETELPLPNGSGNTRTVTGSADLIFQPASLRLVDITDDVGADQPNADGMVAGTDWTARVEALTSTGQVAANFGLEQPAQSVSTSVGHLTPAAGTLGTWREPSSWQAAAPNGLAPQGTQTFNYDDVGTIELTLGFDGGYLGTSWAPSTSQTLGRFIASTLMVNLDDFIIASQCSNQAFLGQPVPISSLLLSVQGYNAMGTVAQNYGLDNELPAPVQMPSWQNNVSTETAGSWQTQTIEGGVQWRLSNASVQWLRQLQAPITEGLSLTLPASVITDVDGVCFGGCTDFTTNSNALTHNFAQLQLLPTSGSELASQSVTAVWEVQYVSAVDGTNTPTWQRLTSDQCTLAPATQFVAAGTCQGFTTAECLSLATARQSSDATDGTGSYQFVGNNKVGRVQVELLADPWLLADMDGDGSYDDRPNALIGFGTWNGQAPILYRLPTWR